MADKYLIISRNGAIDIMATEPTEFEVKNKTVIKVSAALNCVGIRTLANRSDSIIFFPEGSS